MATAKKTEVVTTSKNELAFSQDVPDYIKQNVGRGSEEVRTDDMVLPRLEIVQAQSPIKDENEDAREGYLFNSVTQEVIGDIAYFIPVYYRTEYLVWKDKDEGGGFFGSFASQMEAEERRQKVIQENNGNPEHYEVVDTPVQYGLRVTPDGSVCEQIVISMAKSKAKVSRKWNSMIQLAGGDRFSRVYKITTFKDENAKGNKFHNFVVQPAGFPPKALYEKAEQLYETIKGQGVRAAHDTVIDNGDESASGVDRGGI